jgi:23S rRNA pseudouridine955/2504/2580 synthase
MTNHSVRHAIADTEDAGQRVDNFLFRELKGVPKGHVYRLLRTGQVRINGRRTKPTRRLEAGDDVRIPPVKLASASPPARSARNLEWLADRIIYEDDSLLVLDKPSGLAVHDGSGLSLGAIEALRALRPRAPYLELVHRLDRDTSGCLLIAKRRSRLRAMHELLRNGEVEKKYLALLSGRLNDAGTVDVPLCKHQPVGGERRVRVDAAGKSAETHFKPLTMYAHGTLVEASIKTGRTHQIRVHAAHLGHPVAGDDKYGEHETNREWRGLGLKRLFLHAASIGFTAPWNDVPLAFNAPLDEELRAVLDRLE